MAGTKDSCKEPEQWQVLKIATKSQEKSKTSVQNNHENLEHDSNSILHIHNEHIQKLRGR